MSTTNILDLNNRVDGLEKSYSANKVMMSDGVTSVEDAVDEINNKMSTKKVLATATADGVKTLSALLDELYPYRKAGAILQVSDYAIFNTRYTTLYGCTSSDFDGNPVIRTVSLKQSGSIIKTTIPSTGTTTDQSANVPTKGITIELYINL